MHPAMIALGVLQIARRSILPLLIGGFAAIQGNVFFLFLILFPAFISVFALIARYLSFRYALEEGHIRIREGVFSRKVRSIPVKRIHNINSSQSPVARLFRVRRLDIETAGGGSAEASFIALSPDAAEEIREFVWSEKRKDPELSAETLSEESPPREIFKISFKDILIAGATTNRMGVIFVALAALFQYAHEASMDVVPQWMLDIIQSFGSLEQEDPLTLVLGGIAVFALLFLVAWLISIVTALTRWHNFTLSDRQGDLHIRSGLFTLREFTIPQNKIQALTCDMSAFRRPFDLMQIKVRSAGHVGPQEGRRMESDVLAPIAHRRRIDYFVKAAFPEADWDGVDWRPVHPYTRTRQFRLLLAILAPVSIGAALAFPELARVLVSTLWLIGAPLAWLNAHLTYKQTGYAWDRDFIYIKTGFLGLHFWVIPLNRVQNARLSQSPFQRIRGLVSLQLDVAGPSGGREAVIPNVYTPDGWLMFNRFTHPRLSPAAAGPRTDDSSPTPAMP